MNANVKVGVSYNLFDGEELLPASIKAIRDKVQYINVVYQTTSNLGNPASPDIVEKLEIMKNEGLIDDLYHYEPILDIPPRFNEVAKRDIGLILAKHNNCDYFLCMDADEFYDGAQFESALNFIVNNEITASAVSIITYQKSPEYQLQGVHDISLSETMFNAYVPFLIKIDKSIDQRHGFMYFPCYIDPTRRLYCDGKFRVFSLQEIAMHHMTTVRKDIMKKFSNTSEVTISQDSNGKAQKMSDLFTNFDFDASRELPEGYAFFNQCLFKKVENRFNINFTSEDVDNGVAIKNKV